MIASDAIALNGMLVRLPLEAPPSVCQLAEQSNLKFDGCMFESSQVHQKIYGHVAQMAVGGTFRVFVVQVRILSWLPNNDSHESRSEQR